MERKITILPEDFENSKGQHRDNTTNCLLATAIKRQEKLEYGVAVGISTATFRGTTYRVPTVGQELISDYCHPELVSDEQMLARLPMTITLTTNMWG